MMSADRGFVSIFDLSTSQLPVMKAEPISPSSSACVATLGGVQQYSEEIRQQQAYNLYKQDIDQSFQTDSRSKSSPLIAQRCQILTYSVENEFFGRRQLSISDFDGTRTIGKLLFSLS